MFEAQGYEAGLLLRQLISGGERSRLGLVQNMSRVQQFEGVTGPISITPQREMMRPLKVLSVKDGQIVSWNMNLEQELKAAEKPAPKSAPEKSKRPTLKK